MISGNKKWINNLKVATPNGSGGTCPYCGSEDTCYSVSADSSGRGTGILWCNECKKAFGATLRGLPITHGIPVPKDIILA